MNATPLLKNGMYYYDVFNTFLSRFFGKVVLCTVFFFLFYYINRAILAVRNICEGNTANQDFVRQLEQRAIVNDDNLGVELHIDDATGRIRVNK